MIRRTIPAMMLALCACAGAPGVEGVAIVAAPSDSPEEPEWRAVTSSGDQELLDRLPELWDRALAAVGRRERRLLAQEGELLRPDAAQLHPAAPPGSYRCRLVRLGREGQGGPAVRAFRDFFCNVAADEDGRLAFTKQTGTELPAGWLYPDGERRWILVGARQAKPGDNSIAYGDDPERNIVGVLERVAPFRWRLVLPRGEGAAALDIYELTPVPLERQAPEAVASGTG